MSLPLLTRKAAVYWSLAVGCSTLLTAQTAYLPLGDERPVAGIIPGDQANPHLAIRAEGGFVVWEDNATDNDGLGISAVALDTHLKAVQTPFRVNLEGKGDQESPRVALLKDGGAVFVWRGGRFGLQSLYARFLSPSNTWLTGDLLLSSTNYPVAATATVGCLTNGNVVVLWSTFGQRATNSMQDVYGQLLSPSGGKIGVQFAVNQFTTYNQRTPAIAPLPTGGFIATWISEQQRKAITVDSEPFISAKGEVSVDIYARVYDENANARGNEFVVNPNLVTCANPQIACAPDGRFVVAWSQGSPVNLYNQWDVYARSFSALGVGGAAVQLNTSVAGAQFAPQFALLGDDLLAIWTSQYQDGSDEGVYGQFLTLNAQLVGSEFKVNSNSVLAQNQPTLAADGFGRFFAAWRSSTVQGKVQPEICGQLYALPGFEPLALATNFAGPVFVGAPTDPVDGGGDSNPLPGVPQLDLPAAPSASGGFVLTKGAYQGLLYNTTAVRVSDSGDVTATTTAAGRYTLKLRVGTRSFSFAGQLDTDGKAVCQKAQGAGLAPVVVRLELDLTGTDQLRGSFADGVVTADFVANKAVYNSKTNPYTRAASYTILIAPPTSDSAVPAGAGYGTVAVDKSGKVKFSAKLADGTAITQSSAIAKNDVWPLFAAPYKPQGRVLSWVQFSANEAEGRMVWIKPGNIANAKVYPSGFTGETKLTASRYTAPAVNQRVLTMPGGSGEIVMLLGGLNSPLTNAVYIDAKNKVMDATSSGVKATISTANGSFQGSFIDPSTAKRVSFTGKLLQDDNYGAGFFLNNNLSGRVFLSPLP